MKRVRRRQAPDESRRPPAEPGDHYGEPRDTVGAHAATIHIRQALHLVSLVRDEGPDATGAYLDGLDERQFYGITVALAAMVDVDQTVEDLLAWTNAPNVEARRRQAAQAEARRVASAPVGYRRVVDAIRASAADPFQHPTPVRLTA